MNDEAATTFLLYLWSVLAFCTVFGLFGSWVARQKQRRELEGLILGALFGPFGVLIEALLPTLYHEKQLPATHYDVPVIKA
jgi:hypothetical protein